MGFQGIVDILFAVRRRKEHALKLRRRKADAALQHFAEVGAEPGNIAALRCIVIRDWPSREERAHHRTDAVHGERNPRLRRILAQTGFQPGRGLLQPLVYRRRKQAQRRIARRHGERIA
ncbi:hypothetical protein D3C73_1411540 [compost metagenome]